MKKLILLSAAILLMNCTKEETPTTTECNCLKVLTVVDTSGQGTQWDITALNECTGEVKAFTTRRGAYEVGGYYCY
jgi:hypothetical protein